MKGLVFQFSGDGKKLLASCTPVAISDPVNEASISKALDQEGLSSLYLFNNACAELARRLNDATDPFTMELGERRDGTYSLAVTPDLMTVLLTITPPYGGKAVTSEEIFKALKDEGIVSGIQTEIIKAAATACRALNKPVAIGRPPVQGENGQLLSLIPEMKERCPHLEDDSSVVDYRDLGGIISVRQGDPLMRRIPPTEGAPGENVKGQTIPGIPGKEAAFAPELSGAAISPEDPDLLIAAIAGQPVIVSNGVAVEPTVTIKNIDLSTGNLTFEGTIIVSGDIASGMKVKASGDIVVNGTVEAAMLEAGGNIEVKGGMIFAHVHAEGSISALYAEKAYLHAGGNIFLRELSMQSELKADGQITVGEQGMKKGHVIGGLCRAAMLLHAVVVGSPAGVPTRIEVGIDPVTREKLTTAKQQIETRQKEAEEIQKSLVYLRDNPKISDTEAIKQKEKSLSAIGSEIAELKSQIKRLQKRLETTGNARVEVERNIYYGVQIIIGDKALTVDDDLETVTFRIEEGQIVH